MRAEGPRSGRAHGLRATDSTDITGPPRGRESACARPRGRRPAPPRTRPSPRRSSPERVRPPACCRGPGPFVWGVTAGCGPSPCAGPGSCPRRSGYFTGHTALTCTNNPLRGTCPAFPHDRQESAQVGAALMASPPTGPRSGRLRAGYAVSCSVNRDRLTGAPHPREPAQMRGTGSGMGEGNPDHEGHQAGQHVRHQGLSDHLRDRPRRPPGSRRDAHRSRAGNSRSRNPGRDPHGTDSEGK